MKLCLVCNFHFSDEQELCPKDRSPLVPIGQDPLLGMMVQDRFKIESVIGRGTMGVVYKATQELIGREVAIKVLHSHLAADNESLKRFHQQAKAASRLNHPHIITLYDYGVLPSGQPYLVMDLLAGRSLRQVLEERHYLPVEEAVPIFKQVCEALGDAHKHGVVHRDVKPDNIVLEEASNQPRPWVKVVDFGIAKLVQGSEDTLTRITRTGTVCGSPTYMSPEQFQGSDVDQRSDIYSLGVVIFEVLTGRVPFIAPDLVTLMGQHVGEPPPKLCAVRPDLEFPSALEKVVQRALAKDPEARQQSTEALFDELEAAVYDKKKVIQAAQSIEELPHLISRKDTKEVEAAREEAMQEVVSSHLANISSKVQAEAPAETHNKASASAQQAARPARARVLIPAWVRLVSIAQGLAPYVLTLVLFSALFYMIRNDERLLPELGQRINEMLKAVTVTAAEKAGGDPERLYAQGKLAAARAVLEKKQKEGRLPADKTELLNRIYLRLAEQEAGVRHYQNAVRLLDKVADNPAQVARARALIKKYRRR